MASSPEIPPSRHQTGTYWTPTQLRRNVVAPLLTCDDAANKEATRHGSGCTTTSDSRSCGARRSTAIDAAPLTCGDAADRPAGRSAAFPVPGRWLVRFSVHGAAPDQVSRPWAGSTRRRLIHATPPGWIRLRRQHEARSAQRLDPRPLRHERGRPSRRLAPPADFAGETFTTAGVDTSQGSSGTRRGQRVRGGPEPLGQPTEQVGVAGRLHRAVSAHIRPVAPAPGERQERR